MNDEIDFDKYDEPRLHMERLYRTLLVEFDFSMRIICPLDAAGIRTIGDLIKHSRKKLLSIKQLGKTSVDTLEKFLSRYDLALAKQ